MIKEVKKRTAEQTALFKKHPSLNVTAGSLYLYDKKAADQLKAMADEAVKVPDRFEDRPCIQETSLRLSRAITIGTDVMANEFNSRREEETFL